VVKRFEVVFTEDVEWLCGKRNFRRRRGQSLSAFFYRCCGCGCAVESCVRVGVDVALVALACAVLMALWLRAG